MSPRLVKAETKRLFIRNAVETDIAAIVCFLDAYLSKDFFMSAGVVRRCVTGDNPDGGSRTPYHVWLAFEEEGDVLVGVAIVSLSGVMSNLLVHPSRRGKGIGSELLLKANPIMIRSKVDMKDGDPTHFYERGGYHVTEEANPAFRYLKSKRNISLMRRKAQNDEQMHFIEVMNDN